MRGTLSLLAIFIPQALAEVCDTSPPVARHAHRAGNWLERRQDLDGAASAASLAATLTMAPGDSPGPLPPPAPAQTPAVSPGVVGGATVENRILVLGMDAYRAQAGYYGLEAYGIPYEAVIVPNGGVTLPPLTSSPTTGRYSGILVMDGLAYQNPTGWASAITPDQWAALYDYQVSFNVRMVRINEYPGIAYGTYGF